MSLPPTFPPGALPPHGAVPPPEAGPPPGAVPTLGSDDVQELVAHSADAADLHAAATALLLELQTGLGDLAAAATSNTERGRRPFRADAEWERRLADVGFKLYLLADQTGVALDPHIRTIAHAVSRRAAVRAATEPVDDWPLHDE